MQFWALSLKSEISRQYVTKLFIITARPKTLFNIVLCKCDKRWKYEGVFIKHMSSGDASPASVRGESSDESFSPRCSVAEFLNNLQKSLLKAQSPRSPSALTVSERDKDKNKA